MILRRSFNALYKVAIAISGQNSLIFPGTLVFFATYVVFGRALTLFLAAQNFWLYKRGTALQNDCKEQNAIKGGKLGNCSTPLYV